MGGLSPLHLILILGIALLVIGPGKLPETGAALGKAIRSFRDAVEGAVESPTAGQPAPTPPPAAPVVPPAAVDQTVPPVTPPDETTSPS